MFQSCGWARALLATSSFITLLPAVQATCGTFTPGPNPYNTYDEVYTATIRNIQVSALVNCTGDVIGTSSPEGSTVTRNCNATNCGVAIPPNYVVQINSTLNVTVPDDQRQGLFDLIKLRTGGRLNTDLADINNTMYHRVDQAGACLEEGNAGYWNFAPTYLCVIGTLGDCTGTVASLTNQSITACGVTLLGPDHYGGDLLVTKTVGLDPEPVPANATQSAPNHAPTANAGFSDRRRHGMSVGWWGSGDGSGSGSGGSSSLVLVAGIALLLSL